MAAAASEEAVAACCSSPAACAPRGSGVSEEFFAESRASSRPMDEGEEQAAAASAAAVRSAVGCASWFEGNKLEAAEAVVAAALAPQEETPVSVSAASSSKGAAETEASAAGRSQWSSLLCKHFLFGRCARKRCRFLHSETLPPRAAEVSGPTAASAAKQQSPPPPSGSSLNERNSSLLPPPPPPPKTAPSLPGSERAKRDALLCAGKATAERPPATGDGGGHPAALRQSQAKLAVLNKPPQTHASHRAAQQRQQQQRFCRSRAVLVPYGGGKGGARGSGAGGCCLSSSGRGGVSGAAVTGSLCGSSRLSPQQQSGRAGLASDGAAGEKSASAAAAAAASVGAAAPSLFSTAASSASSPGLSPPAQALLSAQTNRWRSPAAAVGLGQKGLRSGAAGGCFFAPSSNRSKASAGALSASAAAAAALWSAEAAALRCKGAGNASAAFASSSSSSSSSSSLGGAKAGTAAQTARADIRFVQAAETLADRYQTPFVCAYFPSSGYVIQFTSPREGVAAAPGMGPLPQAQAGGASVFRASPLRTPFQTQTQTPELSAAGYALSGQQAGSLGVEAAAPGLAVASRGGDFFVSTAGPKLQQVSAPPANPLRLFGAPPAQSRVEGVSANGTSVFEETRAEDRGLAAVALALGGGAASSRSSRDDRRMRGAAEADLASEFCSAGGGASDSLGESCGGGLSSEKRVLCSASTELSDESRSAGLGSSWPAGGAEGGGGVDAFCFEEGLGPAAAGNALSLKDQDLLRVAAAGMAAAGVVGASKKPLPPPLQRCCTWATTTGGAAGAAAGEAALVASSSEFFSPLQTAPSQRAFWLPPLDALEATDAAAASVSCVGSSLWARDEDARAETTSPVGGAQAAAGAASGLSSDAGGVRSSSSATAAVSPSFFSAAFRRERPAGGTVCCSPPVGGGGSSASSFLVAKTGLASAGGGGAKAVASASSSAIGELAQLSPTAALIASIWKAGEEGSTSPRQQQKRQAVVAAK